MSAEWCEHEPPVLIHDKGGIPIQSAITFAGFAPQDTIDGLPAPSGHINGEGNLVVNVKAPSFPWAFVIVTRIGPGRRFRSRVAYGNRDAPLEAGQDMRVVVTLP